jgi:predicted O-methyltransferase YrrM
MAATSKFIDTAIHDYLLKISVRENPFITALNEATNETFNIPMQSSLDALNYYQWLIEVISAKHVIEVGTYTGLSSLAMALALPEEGTLITCDKSTNFTEFAKSFWKQAGVDSKIKLMLGDAKASLATLLETKAGHFDLAFIDADKPAYSDYFELCLKLVRSGGTIMLDNVFLDGSVIDESNQANRTQIMRKFNDDLFNDPRITLTTLPFGDGLTLARKR